MKYRLATATFVAIMSSAAAASANQAEQRPGATRELTLEEVTHSVETTFPLLRAAERDRVVAEAQVLSAQGGFDPAVRVRATTIPHGGYENERLDLSVDQPTAIWGTRFFGGWRYGRGSFAPYDGKYETADHGEARIGADVPLWRDGPIDPRRANLQKAEIGTTAARLSIEEQKLVTVRAASYRYWEWAAAGRRLAVARDLLSMATTRDAQLGARVERGDLPAYERAENIRVMHQREAQVAMAERALEAAGIELSLYLRTDGGNSTIPDRARLPAALPVVSPLPATSDARTEADALAERPEPKRYEALIEQTRIELNLAKNQAKPGIDLVVIGAKDLGAGPPKITPAELEVSLLVDIPILTRVQDGKKRAAEAQMEKLSEQARYARDRVVADVRDALSTIRRARDRASAIQREIDAARSLVASERERFDLGDSTLLMVNLREQAYAEAELREVDAIADHHRGLAALRAAVGRKK